MSASAKITAITLTALTAFSTQFIHVAPAYAQSESAGATAEEISAYVQSVIAAAESGGEEAAAAVIVELVNQLVATYGSADAAQLVLEQVLIQVSDALEANPALRAVLVAAVKTASSRVELPALQTALANYASVIEAAGPAQTIPTPPTASDN